MQKYCDLFFREVNMEEIKFQFTQPADFSLTLAECVGKAHWEKNAARAFRGQLRQVLIQYIPRERAGSDPQHGRDMQLSCSSIPSFLFFFFTLWLRHKCQFCLSKVKLNLFPSCLVFHCHDCPLILESSAICLRKLFFCLFSQLVPFFYYL